MLYYDDEYTQSCYSNFYRMFSFCNYALVLNAGVFCIFRISMLLLDNQNHYVITIIIYEELISYTLYYSVCVFVTFSRKLLNYC